MVQEVDYIWMDNKLVKWKSATVHILTHTLHYGSGVFEGIRCYKTVSGSAIFRLKEHVTRLFNSAKIMKIKIPYTEEEIKEAIKKTIIVNRIKECYIRPIVYNGYGQMGLNTASCKINVAIIIWPWGSYLGEESLEKGIKAKIVGIKRETSAIANAKICGNYVKSIIAKREAVESGYDEAILFDDRGYLAEGSGENIFIVKNNIIKTPSLGAILPGITRDSIIQLARDMNYRVEECQITKDELYSADEVFLCGTAAELTPVRIIDNKIIGIGKRGKITTILQKKFFDVIRGRDEKYEKWLTHVR